MRVKRIAMIAKQIYLPTMSLSPSATSCTAAVAELYGCTMLDALVR